MRRFWSNCLLKSTKNTFTMLPFGDDTANNKITWSVDLFSSLFHFKLSTKY